MTKNRSKMIIICLSIVLVIGLVASFVSFTYPFTVNNATYKYSSFVDELVFGADVSDGVFIEYEARLRSEETDDSNYNKLLNNTIDELDAIISDSGFKNSSVVQKDDNAIRVEIGGIVDKEDSNKIIELIGNPGELVFSSTEKTDGEFMTGEQVESIKVKEYANGVQAVLMVEITFTDEGFKTMQDETANLTQSGGFYMLLGDDVVGNSKEPVTTKTITMSSDEFVDKTTANQYAIRLRTGLLPLELVAVNNGTTISANLGYNAINYIWLALIIMVVASILFFIFKYKQIGLMASFNMLFYIVLGLFFLQSIPLIHINLSGIFAIIISYILAVTGLMTTLEKAKHNYATGKKLHVSLRQGINSTLSYSLITNIMIILAGIVCALMPNMAIQSFGLVSLVLGFINLFCSQALMRLMIKLYLAINPYNGAKCRFVKAEVNTKEGSNNA